MNRFTRVEGWQGAFWGVIEESRDKRFQLGVWDCGAFAAACVDAMCGTTLREDLRDDVGEYDATTATVMIEAHAGLLMFASEYLGPAVRWQECTTGDVVLARNEEGEVVLAVHEGHALLLPAGQGLAKLPLAQAVVGWRIG